MTAGDSRRILWIGVLVLALAPSAWLAWTWRAMPHLGALHDDGLYWVSAKSLAAGDGYRIESLPGQPLQTKYPPLYPFLLALIWKINPSFPGNLPWAMLLAWCILPVFLLLVREFLKQYGFSPAEQMILVALAALNPTAVLYSISLMPDMLFATLLLASLLVAERATDQRSPGWFAALAGVLCGVAYLSRSAALPVLVTAPLCFALRKQFLRGGLFLAGMLPAVAGWQLWMSSHLSHAQDLVTLYYTNYLAFYFYNVKTADLPLVIWHNFDALLLGIGKALTFDVELNSKILERVVSIAAITGCVRLARRTGRLQYPLAATGFSLLLLIWHYQPDQRLVLPLYPLLLAGLWTEIRRLCVALRISWEKPALADRIVAGAAGAALAAFVGFVAFTSFSGEFVFLPRLLAAHRRDFNSRRPAYEWIAKHAPASANVFAYDDSLLYLYTGRRSCGMPIPPKLYFHDDDAGIDRLLRSIPGFASENQLDFLLLSRGDFYRDLHAPGAQHLTQAVESNPRFHPLYRTPSLAIYKFDR